MFSGVLSALVFICSRAIFELQIAVGQWHMTFLCRLPAQVGVLYVRQLSFKNQFKASRNCKKVCL